MENVQILMSRIAACPVPHRTEKCECHNTRNNLRARQHGKLIKF